VDLVLKVLKQAAIGKGDYHSFPESVDHFANEADVFTKTGGDGVMRTWVLVVDSTGPFI
jgi:hypothetical protein